MAQFNTIFRSMKRSSVSVWFKVPASMLVSWIFPVFNPVFGHTGLLGLVVQLNAIFSSIYACLHCAGENSKFLVLWSAEPTWRAPYFNDPWWHILWQCTYLDYRYQKIASNPSISVGTADNIFKLFEATGEAGHKSQPKGERRLDSHHECCIVGMICSTL